MAAPFVRRAGFQQIHYLKGHMANWRKQKFREER
jgi:hypothetical protein